MIALCERFEDLIQQTPEGIEVVAAFENKLSEMVHALRADPGLSEFTYRRFLQCVQDQNLEDYLAIDLDHSESVHEGEPNSPDRQSESVESWPRDRLFGVTTEQLHHLIYSAFDDLEDVRIRPSEGLHDSPVLRYAGGIIDCALADQVQLNSPLRQFADIGRDPRGLPDRGHDTPSSSIIKCLCRSHRG